MPRNRRKAQFSNNARINVFIGQKEYLSAPELYRVTLPHTFLTNNSNMRAGWMMADKVIAMLSTNYKPALQLALRDVFGHDILVLRRTIGPDGDAGKKLCQDLRALSKQLKDREALLVYESDDDYSGRYRPADVVPGMTWAPFIGEVDAVIASTGPLAKLMAEESGGKPAFVTPNRIHYSWFTGASREAERQRPEKLVVMVAGTRTHDEDWRPVAEAMPRILKDYGNVAFTIGGHMPDYLYGEEWYEYCPPVHYSAYPAMLRQADILCCALEPDDLFNRSKSYIKAIEGWSAARPVGKTGEGGCAVVASKAIPYRGVVQHRNTGLLTDHTADAWEAALRLLIKDTSLRQKVQVNGLRRARHYDIATGWRDWYQTYSSILALRGQERRVRI